MTRVRDGVLTLVAGIIAIALAGCGAGAPPPDSAVVPAGQSLELTGPQVEIYAAVERVVILGFRIDFPRMRNVTYLVGFRPEQWEQVVQVRLTDLQDFQIAQGGTLIDLPLRPGQNPDDPHQYIFFDGIRHLLFRRGTVRNSARYLLLQTNFKMCVGTPDHL